jgi:hypothetical protein
MNEHTPGPWYCTPIWMPYAKDDHGPIAVRITNYSAWNDVDVEKDRYTLNAQIDCIFDENEADGRLMAAAPDLLAVVEELVESADYWSEYDVPVGIVDRMKAAIAKAREEVSDD